MDGGEEDIEDFTARIRISFRHPCVKFADERSLGQNLKRNFLKEKNEIRKNFDRNYFDFSKEIFHLEIDRNYFDFAKLKEIIIDRNYFDFSEEINVPSRGPSTRKFSS